MLRSLGKSGTFGPATAVATVAVAVGTTTAAWDSKGSMGKRPGGPTRFLRPLETIPCLCLVMKPLSATGMTFPSELSEDSKYETSMGCMNESEPWWLDDDSDWNRPLIGERDRKPSRCRRWAERCGVACCCCCCPVYRGRSLVLEVETRIVSSAEKLARSALVRTTKVLFLDVAWEVGGVFLWKDYIYIFLVSLRNTTYEICRLTYCKLAKRRLRPAQTIQVSKFYLDWGEWLQKCLSLFLIPKNQ